MLTARRGHEIEAVAERVRRSAARSVAGDITDGAFVEELADRAVAELGGLTLWVSNAVGRRSHPAAPRRHARPAVGLQLDVNLRAVFTGARAARVMDDGGSIINISSTAALKASPNNGPYAVAKAGVDSLTKTLSIELAPGRSG